jgi:hypothetical protein
LLFESKSITASVFDIVEDYARHPSEELVYRAVATDNMCIATSHCIISFDSEADEHNESFSSSQFGSDQGSSRWDSTGTRNKKGVRSLTPAVRRKSYLEAPLRPELIPSLKDNRETT